jgi:ferredoxin
MSRLRVDRIACSGHGSCAELLPELIALDEWGYPLIPDPEVPVALEQLAARAVSTCPALALRLTDHSKREGSPAPTRTTSG